MITHPQHWFTAHPGTQQVLHERLVLDTVLMPPEPPSSPLKPWSQRILHGPLHHPALEGMGQYCLLSILVTIDLQSVNTQPGPHRVLPKSSLVPTHLPRAELRGPV